MPELPITPAMRNHKSSEQQKSPVTILMVDDQPGKLLSYDVILQELGETLVKATSARDALEHLLKLDVAMVLLDVSMPEIDGFELADMMRQHPRFQNTPIIFVSAVHLTDVDRIRAYRSGAVDYISVPVVPDVLRAKVSVFAELHRTTRELQELNRELESRVAERSEALRVLNAQLHERVAELETIMKVLPVGVAVAHDASCETLTGNAALREILDFDISQGLNDQALDRAGWKVFKRGSQVDSGEMPIQASLRTMRPTGLIELELRRKDAVVKSVLASASPLFDEAGGIRGAVGAFFDLTEQKQMEERLRERAELLELASEAIMVRDWSGIVHFWNAGAEALYGWTREEVMGKNAHALLATKWPVSVEAMRETLSFAGRWDGNLVHQCKDGREVVVASRQAITPNGAMVFEINRDITTQLQAEEALRRNERLAAMGKLAGIVAHEINNPLEAITNTFYLLREHPSLSDEARHYAQLADQELARVGHITKQTLSFYRESQKAVVVYLTDLLEDVLELHQTNLLRSGIEVETIYKTRGESHGFPGELKQALMNLVSNSIQAMPQGGRLRVRVRNTSEKESYLSGLIVSITDSGCGISPEASKRLFEPFFTTKEAKGTGLGLWISRGIIEKHEGTLTFRSHFGKQVTTCFQIFLPTHRTIRSPNANRPTETLSVHTGMQNARERVT
ncbi:response regulator [Edaphobacter sp. HDX4]|uniref:ATP-binding protein n=1 Tax=Edaphobacter sp. HDX4 TaxID=2794064 RepID=UPI002FE6AAD9